MATEGAGPLFQGVDKGSFAYKLLNKMGWSEGSGLVSDLSSRAAWQQRRLRRRAGFRRPAAAALQQQRCSAAAVFRPFDCEHDQLSPPTQAPDWSLYPGS